MEKTNRSEKSKQNLYKWIIGLYIVTITFNLTNILFTVSSTTDVILNSIVVGISCIIVAMTFKQYRNSKHKEG